MVDAIGINVGKPGDRRIAPVTRVATTPAVQTATMDDATVSTAATLAARPPVDAERVRAIKAAVADGSFPISPAKIADRLIALRYEWMQNDQA